MRVCLICVEMFGWGKYGGFGRATRTLGSELVRRGVEVHAVVPRRRGQRPVEQLDGMTVLGFPMLFPPAMAGLFREVDADLYHTQHPSLAMRVALEVMPHRRHLVTFRDPKTGPTGCSSCAILRGTGCGSRSTGCSRTARA